MNEESAWHKDAKDKWYLLAAINRKQKITDNDVKRIAWKQSTYERYIIMLDLLESEGAIKIDRNTKEYLQNEKTSEKCTFYLYQKLIYSRESFLIKSQGWLIYITAFAIIPSTIFQGMQLYLNIQQTNKTTQIEMQLDTLTTKKIPLLEEKIYHLSQKQDMLTKKQLDLKSITNFGKK